MNRAQEMCKAIKRNTNRNNSNSNNNNKNKKRYILQQQVTIPTVNNVIEESNPIEFRKLLPMKQKSSFTSPIQLLSSRMILPLSPRSPKIKSTVSDIVRNDNKDDDGGSIKNEVIMTDDDITNDDNDINGEHDIYKTSDNNNNNKNNNKVNKDIPYSDVVGQYLSEKRIIRSKFTLKRPTIEFDEEGYADYMNSSLQVTSLDHGIDSPVVITPRKKGNGIRFPSPQLDIMTTKLSPRTVIHKHKLQKKRDNKESSGQWVSNRERAPPPPPSSSLSSSSPNQIVDELSSYEQQEMCSYSRVYYAGDASSKVEVNEDLPNNGFDNLQGDYIVCRNDHIAYRYQFLDVLGRGSFGFVFKCEDHKMGGQVAMKIIRNRPNFRTQADVELKVLVTLKN